MTSDLMAQPAICNLRLSSLPYFNIVLNLWLSGHVQPAACVPGRHKTSRQVFKAVCVQPSHAGQCTLIPPDITLGLHYTTDPLAHALGASGSSYMLHGSKQKTQARML